MAPFLVLVIVGAFAVLRKEWWIFWKSLWWPGIALYFAIVLPWFIAVQHQNPTFSRVFLEHNLWSALPPTVSTRAAVLVLPGRGAAGPVYRGRLRWPSRALYDGIRVSIIEWRIRHARLGPGQTLKLNTGKIVESRPGDAFPEFLVL